MDNFGIKRKNLRLQGKIRIKRKHRDYMEKLRLQGKIRTARK
jgi:ribosomal protein L30/L7E